nr:MAG TPA: Major capsid protein [Caudoviricetes sp.]
MAEVETKTDVKETETKEQEKETEKEGTKTEQKEDKPEVDVEAVKEQAVKDYMKSLGIEDDEKLKGIVTKAKEDEEKNKTDLEKKDDVIKETTRQLVEEREARQTAEAKLAAIKLGAKPEAVDDLVVIAKSRVTKDKDINKVIAEIKDGTNGKMYFVSDEEEKEQKNKKPNVTRKRVSKNTEQEDETIEDKYEGSIAARLFANKKKPTKSNYFK